MRDKTSPQILTFIVNRKCRRENLLDDVALAVKYPRTKFLRLKSSEASSAFDTIALPILLIYRNANLIRCVMRVHEELRKFQRPSRKFDRESAIDRDVLEQYISDNLE